MIEIVEIIDHQSMRLAQRRLGKIAEGIEPLEPRAIAQMKARDGIDDAARSRCAHAGNNERRAAAARARSASRAAALARPVRLIEQAPGRVAPASKSRANFRPPLPARSQPAKPGAGDSVTKLRQPRQFALQFLDHLLDQEIAETDPRQAALRVGDRIENRRRRRLRRQVRCDPARARARSPPGMESVSATSTKISGSSPSAG